MEKQKESKDSIDRVCPVCKSKLRLKKGRNGPFWGCTAYPNCDFTISEKSDTVKISDETEATAVSRLSIALKFIRECGGVENAITAINGAALMVDACSGREEK